MKLRNTTGFTLVDRRAKRGFTLVELSIVLAIIAAITGMGLVATLGAVDSAKIASTNRKLDVIERALWAYRVANNRLPCPGNVTYGPGYVNSGAVVGGLEADNVLVKNALTSTPPYVNAPPGLCNNGTVQANFVFGASTNSVATADAALTNSTLTTFSVEGGVPVKTLGLPDEYLYDAWGRMFAYAVDTRLTTPYGFSSLYPLDPPSISVVDAAAAPRSSDVNSYIDYAVVCGSYQCGGIAAYVLLSYGPSGYGGYIANPGGVNSRMPNCSPTSSTYCKITAANNHDGSTYYAQYYQMDWVEDSTGGSNLFNDLVRFKDRNELFTYDDSYNFANGGYNAAGYRGPPFFYPPGQSAQAGITPSMIPCYTIGGALDNDCAGIYSTSRNLSATGTNITGMAMTPDNKALFVYSNLASYNCAFYTITGMEVSVTATPPTVSNCPVSADFIASNPVAMSNNGYLAIGDTVAVTKVIKISKWTGSTFVTLPNITPGFTPTIIAFSRNANYLAVSDGTKANTIVYWRNSNNTWTAAATQFTSLPSALTNVYGMAFSPNGKYFAAIGTGNLVTVWPLNLGTPKDPFNANFVPTPYTKAGPTQAPTAATQNGLVFSPDSNYIYAAGAANAAVTSSFVIYHLDLTSTAPGLLLTAVNIDDTFGYAKAANIYFNGHQLLATYTPKAAAWSPDSNYVAIEMTNTTGTYFVLNRISTLNFEQTPPLGNTSNGTANTGVAFFH